jgi:hypothetical protein
MHSSQRSRRIASLSQQCGGIWIDTSVLPSYFSRWLAAITTADFVGYSLCLS